MLEFPAFGDGRGRLAFLEGLRHVPFSIGRVQWWNNPVARDAAAHPPVGVGRVLLAVAGRADVRVRGDGVSEDARLDRPDRGVLVPRGAAWELVEASDDAVLVTLSEAREPHAEPAAGTGRRARPSTVDDARLLRLGGSDADASTTSVTGHLDVPFGVERIYYLFDVPPATARGSHAHKELEQLIVAVAGSFDVRLNDGATDRIVTLDRPDVGLLMPHMLWRDLERFTPGAVCLVLASLPYDEADYIRERDVYVAYRRARTPAS